MKKTIYLVLSFCSIFYSSFLFGQCTPNDSLAFQLPSGPSCGSVPCENLLFLDGDSLTFYTTSDCRKIISIKDSLNGISLGNVSVCETVNCSLQFYNGIPILNRYFKISADTNTGAYVSLYITNQDIIEYNSAIFGIGGTTINPLTNLVILQIDSTLLAGNPIASTTIIPNSSIYTSFNSTLSIWTISFPVDSFCYFYITTPHYLTNTYITHENVEEPIIFNPNPCKDMLSFKFANPDLDISSIEILDLTGKSIFETLFPKSLINNKVDLDVSSLISGSYLIRFRNLNKTLNTKLFTKM